MIRNTLAFYCLLIYLLGNSHKSGLTDHRFPALIPGINCHGTESLLSSCVFAPLSDLSHCSIEVVELNCKGKGGMKYYIALKISGLHKN